VRSPSYESGDADADAEAGVPAIAVDSEVEVRSRFDGRWCRGFAVAAVVERGYRLRRLSDGTVLPAVFDERDLAVSGGWGSVDPGGR
jgi:hypothetical protein